MNIPEIIASLKDTGLPPTAEAFAALVDAYEALRAEADYHRHAGGVDALQAELSALRVEHTRYKAEIAKDREVMSAQESDNASLSDRLSGAELERDRLGAELGQLEERLAQAHQMNANLATERDALRAENKLINTEKDRLRDGLTKALDQIHDMCHDLHVSNPAVSVEDFCAGCEKFQIEKFGESPITHLRTRIAILEQDNLDLIAKLEEAEKSSGQPSPHE